MLLKASVLFYCAGSLLVSANPVKAGDIWSQIHRSDQRIGKCHSVWIATLKQFPVAYGPHQPDPDQEYQRALDTETRKGDAPEEAKNVASAVRRNILRSVSGFEIPRKFTYEFDGKSYLADMVYGKYQDDTGSLIYDPANSARISSMELFKGDNYIEITKAVPNGENPDTYAYSGGVWLNGHSGATHSFGQWPTDDRGGTIALFGAPVLQAFGPLSSQVIATANGSVNLQRDLVEPLRTRDRHFEITMTLDKKFLRPTSIVAIDLDTRRKDIAFQYDISGYHQYTDGQWFPSLVVITNFQNAVQQGKLVRIPFTTDTYRLQEVSFGQNADLNQLHGPLPTGTVISDYRFGTNNGLSYTTNGKLMPMEQMEKIRESGRRFAAQQMSRRAGDRRQFAILLVISVLVCSVVIYSLLAIRRSNRTRPGV